MNFWELSVQVISRVNKKKIKTKEKGKHFNKNFHIFIYFSCLDHIWRVKVVYFFALDWFGSLKSGDFF